jgi:DNA-binding NarL/FixJ family response regulator
MTGPARVLIVDDDALVRAGLSMMLDGADGIAVVGEAADGDQVAAAVAAHSPDVVLMDLRMPRVDGITATRQVRARPHPPEVIVLTTFDTDENVLHALRAGASGFLLKDSPPRQIAEAIRRVAAGDPIRSPKITRRLMDRAAAEAGTRGAGRHGGVWNNRRGERGADRRHWNELKPRARRWRWMGSGGARLARSTAAFPILDVGVGGDRHDRADLGRGP